MQIPFVGPSYETRFKDWDTQQTVNLYLLRDETGNGKSPISLNSTPGLKKFLQFPDNIRGILTSSSGRCFCVHGAAFGEIFSDGTFHDYGSLATSDGTVGLADNGVQIMVVDGDNGYVFVTATNQWLNITTTAEGWTGSDTVTFLQSYFIFTRPNSQVFYISGNYDGTSIDPLDFASAESNPDNLVVAQAFRNNVWLLGTNSYEVWYNSGDQLFPFALTNGSPSSIGCVAPHSVAVVADSLLWLGRDQNGTGSVYLASNYQAMRISTDAVDYAIQSYENISDATAFGYQMEGHNFYVLNFPSAQTTWCFDLNTGQWHERQYLNPISGQMERARPNYHTVAFGKHLVTDYSNGKVYEYSLNLFDDDGDPIRRVRRCPHITNSNGFPRIFYSKFQLDMQTGIGTFTGNDVNPLMVLRWSNDGGHTWSSELYASAGASGQFLTRVIWRRLGFSRSRVWEVSTSAAVPQCWMSADVDMKMGNS